MLPRAKPKRSTRRGFLRAAAALAAAPAAVPQSALGGPDAAPPSERVTIGYIGTGWQGLKANLPMLLGCREAQVLAVCDVWDKNLRLAKNAVDNRYGNGKCQAYVDFRELLDRRDLDAVGIATPDHWHVPMAIAAMEAGKDVHLEKPLGICLAQDIACRDAVRRTARVFQYGAESRSTVACRAACELVRSGRIGPLRHIEVLVPLLPKRNPARPPQPAPAGLHYDLWLGPAPWRPFTTLPMEGAYPFPWYYVRDFCAGWINNWAAHLLDLLQWGFDTHLAGPWEVEGTGTIAAEADHDVVANWDVRIRFANGVTMAFRGGGELTRFVGADGQIALRYGGVADEATRRLIQESPPPTAHRLTVSDNHERHFIQCVKTRATPVSPIEDAVHSDSLAHIAEIAVRTRHKITWSPRDAAILGDPEAARLLSRPTRAPWST